VVGSSRSAVDVADLGCFKASGVTERESGGRRRKMGRASAKEARSQRLAAGRETSNAGYSPKLAAMARLPMKLGTIPQMLYEERDQRGERELRTRRRRAHTATGPPEGRATLSDVAMAVQLFSTVYPTSKKRSVSEVQQPVSARLTTLRRKGV
jgi:hypothetical protein